MSYFFKLFKNEFLFLLVFFLGLNSVCFANFNKSTFASNGRVQFDYIIWQGDLKDDLLSGPYIKSTDLFVKGILGHKSLSYFLHLSFLNLLEKNNFSQGYIKYSCDEYIIKFGQIIVPFGLEQSIDSGNKVFMEAVSLKGIDVNKYFGFNVKFIDPIYTFSISFIVPELGNSLNRKDKPKYSMVIRTTVNPLKNSGLLHLGISYKLSKTNINEISTSSIIGFKDTPTFMNYSSILSSHSSTLPRHYVFGLEYLTIIDSLSFQSEFFHVEAYWRDFNKENYYSWYAQLSYILTGESRRYDRLLGSVFDPKPSFDYGLLEFAVRYSYTNLVNKGPLLRGLSLFDGYKNSLAFAMNWIINSSFKLQLNYASEKYVYRVENRGKRNVSGIGMRVQFVF